MSAHATDAVEPLRLSWDEFLRFTDDTPFSEWVYGEVIRMTPVAPQHQLIANFLVSLFQHFCETHGAGIVLSAPVVMKLDRSGREPDVMVLRPEHRERIAPAYVNGPADLVVEVVSPDSRTRDRRDKLREYEQAGIPEYWILDSERTQAMFYSLNSEGKYVPLPVVNGIVRSRVLDGLWLRVEWLWQEPLPPLLSVLREWGLV